MKPDYYIGNEMQAYNFKPSEVSIPAYSQETVDALLLKTRKLERRIEALSHIRSRALDKIDVLEECLQDIIYLYGRRDYFTGQLHPFQDQCKGVALAMEALTKGESYGR